MNQFSFFVGFKYENLEQTIRITHYTGTKKHLVIPSHIGQKSVVEIGKSAFSRCTTLISIVIPNSVTSIGREAFSECTSLVSIGTPASVISIGDCAFWDCTSLTSIIIPNSVTSIGDYAFSRCTSLVSIVIPDGMTFIAKGTFSECTSLVSIVIPDSVTSIGIATFSDCTSLVSIVIPDSVTSIGTEAFSECTSLVSIAIPESVTHIGVLAFSEFTTLVSSKISPKVLPLDSDINNDQKSINLIDIHDLVKRLNEVSPVYDKYILEKLAQSCDQNTSKQNLFMSSVLYLYAFYNGSLTAKKRLHDMGYCPDYFKEIVDLSENRNIDSAGIAALFSSLAKDTELGTQTIRSLVTLSFLFIDTIAGVGVVLFNNYDRGSLEYDLAIKLCNTAADSELGHGKASVVVGNHYYGLKDYAKSFEYFSRAVEKGDEDAMYSLSGFYFSGIGETKKNRDKAKDLLLQAAEKGNLRAIAALEKFFI